jgi:2-iminobutanoate/2-iminopropanoate deaminase
MTALTPIHTDSAPKAIGPYSQAIRAGELLFCSGQIPLDPATMTIVEGDIETQTRRVLQNLSAVLAAAGTSLNRVVKTTVFLTDLGEFARMNAVYAEFFTDTPPARSTVPVAALPRNAKIEVEAIALISG